MAARFRKAKKRKKKKRTGENGGDDNNVSKGFIEFNGVVEESLPAGTFKVRLENDQTILAHLSGRMRMFRIRLLPGDEVKVEMTPYDLTKGRITFRY